MKYYFLLLMALSASICQGQTVNNFKLAEDNVEISLSEGTIIISSLTENAVRVQYYKGIRPEVPELVLTSKVITDSTKGTLP